MKTKLFLVTLFTFSNLLYCNPALKFFSELAECSPADLFELAKDKAALTKISEQLQPAIAQLPAITPQWFRAAQAHIYADTTKFAIYKHIMHAAQSE